MNVEIKEDIALLVPDNSSSGSIIEDFNSAYTDVKDHHLVLDLSNQSKETTDIIIKFQDISDLHRSEGKSFVFIANCDLDLLPEALIVVPTYQEALDIIEMESIERDLGL